MTAAHRLYATRYSKSTHVSPMSILAPTEHTGHPMTQTFGHATFLLPSDRRGGVCRLTKPRGEPLTRLAACHVRPVRSIWYFSKRHHARILSARFHRDCPECSDLASLPSHYLEKDLLDRQENWHSRRFTVFALCPNQLSSSW